MQLYFLGKGSAFYPPYGNTGCYLKKDGKILMIDCGESIFESFYRMEKIDKIKDLHVVITHMHADHVGSLATLISYFYYVLDKKVYVYHAEEKIKNLLRLQGINDNEYIFKKKIDKEIFGIEIEYIPVKHSNNMNSYGLKITSDSKKIYYSGDAADIPSDIIKDFKNKDIDNIYQDTSSIPSKSHCYYKKLIEYFTEEERGRIYCMHLDSKVDDILIEEGFKIPDVKI